METTYILSSMALSIIGIFHAIRSWLQIFYWSRGGKRSDIWALATLPIQALLLASVLWQAALWQAHGTQIITMTFATTMGGIVYIRVMKPIGYIQNVSMIKLFQVTILCFLNLALAIIFRTFS